MRSLGACWTCRTRRPRVTGITLIALAVADVDQSIPIEIFVWILNTIAIEVPTGLIGAVVDIHYAVTVDILARARDDATA